MQKLVVVFVVGLGMAIISPFLYEHLTGVGVMRASITNKREKTVAKRRPVARAYIIGAGSENGESQIVVPIYSVDEIYASVGVGPNDFVKWQESYGFGNLGRTDDGVLFVPNYPVLSQIAWMGINPIDLSSEETSMLIEECTKAKNTSVSTAASTELDALAALARKAIALGGAVRFGLP